MVVGADGVTKTWHLPKELLINASPFFAAALIGSFVEAASKEVKLPEDDTDAFALFIRWLYIGETAAIDCICGYDYNEPHRCPAASVQTYVQAWILGDKLGCPIFKDIAMLGLVRTYYPELINTKTVRIAYEKSAPGSKLRKCLLDLVRYEAWAGAFETDAVEWMSFARHCVDFGKDLMRAMFETGEKEVKHPFKQKAKYLEVLKTNDDCA